jgi:hypothetical protein
MMARNLQSENIPLVQAIDFSRLAGLFQLILRFFTPFLSHKELVSRRLRTNQGLFKSRAGCWRTASPSGRAQGLHPMLGRADGADMPDVPLRPGWSRVVSHAIFWEEAGQAPTSGGLSPVYRGGNPAFTEVNRRKPRYTELTRFENFYKSEGDMILEMYCGGGPAISDFGFRIADCGMNRGTKWTLLAT